MKIGAHVSAAGSLDKAVDRAVAIGAEAVQIFVSPPQGWRHPMHSPEVIEAFRTKMSASGVAPAFVHGVYLINLATDNQENLQKGIESLTSALVLASKIGAKGVVFHVGGHGGAGLDAVVGQIADSLSRVLAAAPADVWLCLENNAGRRQQIGATFEELARIMALVSDDRLRVCLDTAHALASGYDIASRDGVARTMDEFDRVVGLDRLVVVHANDSKVPLGGNNDRHENIGDGFIGSEGWRHILGHPAFLTLPLLMEVPGLDGKSGPDKANVDRLKAIREQALAGA